MNNQRPLSKRKTVQALVILTILAWATETLLHQWGYGQEVPQAAPSEPLTVAADMIDGEKFVPSDRPAAIGGALELRAEATVVGGDVKLKQICRWSDADAALFTPIADLTIAHLSQGTAFRVLTVEDIRQTLLGSGTNLAMINFVGQTRCTVTRSDAQVNPHEAIDDWIAAHNGSAAKAANDSSPSTQPAAPESAAILAASKDAQPDPAFHSLRDLLTADICQRLGVAPEQIQMTFSPQDQKVLGLYEPVFKFEIKPGRAFNLGVVNWDVTICSDSANKKVSIIAVARAWQDQVIVAKPLAYKQMLRADDFTTRRILADTLAEQTLLRLDQCVGQQAAGDYKPGTVMTARMVDPVPLVRAGQLVTVTLTQGSVQIRSVGRAMEQGSLGQNIKVRNETTRDVFDVTVTGPQEGRLGGESDTAAPAVGS
jgi:flagella basal body P-ring formation protein FlgA